MRAGAKGIVQSTDLVPMGWADDRCSCCITRPGRCSNDAPTGSCLRSRPTPAELLFHELKAAGTRVERVGDCVAPRRAHAAVIDGERVGAAI